MKQDVARPDEDAMQESHDEKPHVAPHINVRRGCDAIPPRDALGEKDHTCTEQHGEHAAHTTFEEDPLDRPDDHVERGVAARECIQRNTAECTGDRKIIDVHDENAQQGKPAKGIDRDDAIGQRHRLGSRRRTRARDGADAASGGVDADIGHGWFTQTTAWRIDTWRLSIDSIPPQGLRGL